MMKHIVPIGSMVLLYMVTWIPSIYPSHVSIYTIHGSYGVGKKHGKKTVKHVRKKTHGKHGNNAEKPWGNAERSNQGGFKP